MLRSARRHWLAGLIVLCGAFLTWHCADKQSPALTHHVMIDSSTTLEVIDWGGTGIPIVFLAGLGHTAHVFDEFAPELADTYHVLGITRRGFGASSQPDEGYDLVSLARDIRSVLDSLGITRTVLAGHSLGGDEMTLFARTYPDRVVGLVYIEAAYNRRSAWDSLARYSPPESMIPPPSSEDKRSAEAFQAYYARINGVTMPLTEIRAMFLWDSAGRMSGSVTPGWIFDQIIESIRDPDYSGIAVPSLAIYAYKYPVTELFIDYADRDSVTQLAMRKYLDVSHRTDELSHDYFRSHMADAKIVEVEGAGHSLYITHKEKVLSAIKQFLRDNLRQVQ